MTGSFVELDRRNRETRVLPAAPRQRVETVVLDRVLWNTTFLVNAQTAYGEIINPTDFGRAVSFEVFFLNHDVSTQV